MTSALFSFTIFIMANPHEHTSSAANTPRLPTPEERTQLAQWLLGTDAFDAEDARLTVQAASIAVFDDYCTGGPGYAGKVMSVVWDGAPSMFDLFLWRNGRLERSGREYDEKECDRCGGRNRTLCWGCWRAYSRRDTEELVAALESAVSALGIAKERDPTQAGLYHCPTALAALAKAKGSAA